MGKGFYCVREIGEMAGVSPAKVRHWADRLEFEPHRHPKDMRKVWYSEADTGRLLAFFRREYFKGKSDETKEYPVG